MNNKELKDIIENDLYRYYGKSNKKNFFKCLIKSPGFKYTYILRHTKYSYENKKRIKYFIYKILLVRYRNKYGYEIPYLSNIGKGFCITHFGGIAINPEANIGNFVNISKGVTIGMEYRGIRKGCPQIGNYVWIGANSTIVGNIIIGENVLIAPGAYVNFDVPSNSIVIGNPGRILENIDATKGYLNNIKKED